VGAVRSCIHVESPWERTCSEWADIVDLRPCISLTLRERARIVEHLKAPGSPSLNLIKRGVLARDSHGQRLLHQCKAYSHIQIEMKLCLTESEQLTVTTCYEGPNIIALPSREVDYQMLICCSKTWLDAMVSRRKPSWSCLNCHAQITNLSSPHSNAAIVYIIRFLGRGEWFGSCKSHRFEQLWCKQCRRLRDHIPISGY
jgi:hypothetical protein